MRHRLAGLTLETSLLFESFLRNRGVVVAEESDDQRVHKLETVNQELRVALKECREQLQRLERLLERSEQDNQPRR